MIKGTGKFRLELLGPFRMFGPDGKRIELASKRGQALMAMLAVAQGGERTRSWLQDRLWGSRQQAQAQASLRRELSNLRKALEPDQGRLLTTDHNRVGINLDAVDVDYKSGEATAPGAGEFLEGIDIPGEDAFEEWLRNQRTIIEQSGGYDSAGQVRLPKTIVDMSKPVPGFRGRPAIAILPLDNQTGDDSLTYLSDGISEELIERLSRLKWLPVIARSASFRFRNSQVGLEEIGKEVGARYVLEGWLRKTADTVRLSLSLADCETGFATWAHASDVPLHFTQAMIDDLIIELVATIDSRIEAVEKNRASLKTETDLSADELIWRARWHIHRYTREDSVLGENFLAKALKLVPNSPEALVQLAFFKGRSIWAERQDEQTMIAFRQLAQRAIVADSEDGRAYMYAGMAEMWMRRTAKAMPLFEKAITLNPSLSLAHAQIGSAHLLAENAAAAIDPLRLALRLGTNNEHTFYVLGELAIAHCMLGHWEDAINHADQSLLRRVAYWYAHTTKINALARSGNIVDAELALRHLLEAKPDFRPSFVDWLPFVDKKWNEFIKAGLRMAGMT